MVAAGLAAAVAALRYLGRDAPRWRRAWAAGTVCVACLVGLWLSAASAEAALTARDRAAYADRSTQWSSHTAVAQVAFARDAAAVGLPPATLLWAWLAWRVARNRRPEADG
jgi:hypothetical protein